MKLNFSFSIIEPVKQKEWEKVVGAPRKEKGLEEIEIWIGRINFLSKF